MTEPPARPIEVKMPSLDPMFLAIGRGIGAFANVETGLAFVFASLMDPADRGLSIAALDAARHIEVKLRIVTAIVDEKLKDDDRTTAHALLNRIKRRTELRRKLAHWAAAWWPRVNSIKDLNRLKVVLLPGMPSRTPNTQPVMLAQVEAFAEQCSALTKDLFDFSIKLTASNSSQDGADVIGPNVGEKKV